MSLPVTDVEVVGVSMSADEGSYSGNSFEFRVRFTDLRLGEQQYDFEGTICGEKLSGTWTSPSANGTWSATRQNVGTVEKQEALRAACVTAREKVFGKPDTSEPCEQVCESSPVSDYFSHLPPDRNCERECHDYRDYVVAIARDHGRECKIVR